MQLHLLGLSHKTAPVEVRERLALPPAQLPRVLPLLREASGAREVVLLSTCNRAEIYAVGAPETGQRLAAFLDRQLGDAHGAHALDKHFYRHCDAASARHLFRVASGVDSLVLGESEILGQVKTAFEAARAQNAIADVLDELFRRAIKCGKRARHETAIGRGALSVGSAAVDLARQIFGPLQGHTVLILGAGKMSALTAQHLVASGARRVLVANRTFERAQELARSFEDAEARESAGSECHTRGPMALAVPWDEISARLAEADIVIASTGAPHHVLGAEQVAAAMKSRRHRPLFLVDIAVPRDIDPAAHQLDNVFLYDIDDLQGVVAANRAQRALELERVESIIDGEVGEWEKWYQSLEARPVMAALAQRAASVRDAEVEATLARLPNLSPREQDIVRALGHAVAQKLIHAPLRHLREVGAEGASDVDVLRRAFALDHDTGGANEAQGETGSQAGDAP